MTARPRLAAIAALALFVALPLLLAALTASNLLRLAAADDLVGRQRGLIAEFDRRLGRLASGAGPAVDTSAIYVRAGNPALAAADLQQRLGALVAAAAGTVIETQVEPAAEGAPADEVRMRLAVDVDNVGLAGLLAAVENGLPLMFVDALSIRAAAASGEATDNPRLRAEMVVRAAWKSP